MHLLRILYIFSLSLDFRFNVDILFLNRLYTIFEPLFTNMSLFSSQNESGSSYVEKQIFLTILCRKCENTVFGYKKGSKIKIDNIFEIFRPELYIEFVLIFLSKWLCVNLCRKVDFPYHFVYKMRKYRFWSLPFCVENVKIPFLVTKRGQKMKLITKISSVTSETLFQHDFYFKKFKTMNFEHFFH